MTDKRTNEPDGVEPISDAIEPVDDRFDLYERYYAELGSTKASRSSGEKPILKSQPGNTFFSGPGLGRHLEMEGYVDLKEKAPKTPKGPTR